MRVRVPRVFCGNIFPLVVFFSYPFFPTPFVASFVASLLIIIIRYLLWSVKYLPLHIVVFIFFDFFWGFSGNWHGACSI